MRVLDPGHEFELTYLDVPQQWWKRIFRRNKGILTFVKREGEGYPGNVGHHPGTNIQDVLRALISRVQYLDRQIPCSENTVVVDHMRRALWMLELRAAKLHNRLLSVPQGGIEKESTCKVCGHVQCAWAALDKHGERA